MSFSEKLSALPVLENLKGLELRDSDGVRHALIENKPGSQGSFRVYHFVAQKWDGVGPEAAREALEIFAEHTQDAKQHPGKHPNIDRLFEIIAQGLRFTVETY